MAFAGPIVTRDFALGTAYVLTLVPLTRSSGALFP
jgi:hypothetical protein